MKRIVWTSCRFKVMAWMSVLVSMLSSCSDGDGEPSVVSPTPEIVFLFSPGGLGDMSYNDCILEGVQRFKMANPGVYMYLYSPEGLDESRRIFSDWLDRPESDVPVLFVLASSDYEAVAEECLVGRSLAANKKVLLFESEKDYGEGVSTFQISMYGASYLAGVTAEAAIGEGDALIVLANPSDSPIHIAKDGFNAGFGKDCAVEYLAEDWSGYVSSSLAYQKMAGWHKEYRFIFPVAGGSNSGIYRFSREYPESPLLAGMDTDQSGLSNNITGSVIKNIDNLIYEYLSEWLQSGDLPEAEIYGLDSGYVDWLLSPSYKSLFNDLVESNRQTAIDKEAGYYE